ncbi:MAG: HI1506-related protein [Desulfobulbia bacterium]
MIQIVSKKEGFRRCGVAHVKGPVDYPDGHWTEEQLTALKAEPMLVVTFIEDESKKGAAKKAEADGKAPTGGQSPEKIDGQAAPVRPNAANSIELAKAAATAEDLDKLAEGEDRKSVLDAIAKRRAELAAKG